jgi:hypothetical protein
MLEPIVAVGALAPPWRLALVSLTPARKYHRLGRAVAVGMALFGSSVEHTGNSEKFRKAVDMTDDELAAIVARAELTVI